MKQTINQIKSIKIPNLVLPTIIEQPISPILEIQAKTKSPIPIFPVIVEQPKSPLIEMPSILERQTNLPKTPQTSTPKTPTTPTVYNNGIFILLSLLPKNNE